MATLARSSRLLGRSMVIAVLVMLVVSCGNDDGTATDAAGDAAVEQRDATVSTDDDATTGDVSADGDEPESGATSQDAGSEAGAPGEELFPDVIGATAEQMADGSWTFSATLSSPYDTPQRYADAWRVLGPDGDIYGIRELTHDHAGEQPFTRSQSGITIPDDVTTVTVQGRDQVSGWGGATVQVELDR